MGKKISALPSASSPASTDLVPMVVSGVTSKVTLAALAGASVSAQADAGAAPALSDSVLASISASAKRLTVQNLFDAQASLSTVTPAPTDSVPLVASGIAKRATLSSVSRAARGKRGDLLWEWNGTDATQLDTGTTRRSNDSGNANGSGGSLAASVAAATLGGYQDGACLRLATTTAAGTRGFFLSGLTLPDDFIVEGTFVGGTTIVGGASGLCVMQAVASGNIVRGQGFGIRLPGGAGNVDGLALTYASGTYSKHVDGTDFVTTDAPTAALMLRGGYRFSAEWRRMKGRTPAQWVCRVTVWSPTGTWSHCARSGSAETFSGGLDGQTADSILVGVYNDNTAASLTVEIGELRVLQG